MVTTRTASRPDPLTPNQRRLNMSRIRGKDTKPELLLRRALHAAGFRYRLHDRKLPGKPDIVMAGRRAVIQVHGCFWHGHDCPRGVMPGTNQAFWIEKLSRNRRRDAEVEQALKDAGWRVLTVWECALTGRARRPTLSVVDQIKTWLAGDQGADEVSGAWAPNEAGDQSM